jgi:hypothetical protein
MIDGNAIELEYKKAIRNFNPVVWRTIKGQLRYIGFKEEHVAFMCSVPKDMTNPNLRWL